MLKMKKKAQTMALTWLIELLLVAAVITTLSFSINKINSGTYFEEKAFSKNLALFYDSIIGSPHSSEGTYKIQESYKLAIDVDENCFVKIINPSQSFNLYYCALDNYLDVNCKTKENCFMQDNFIAIKNGN